MELTEEQRERIRKNRERAMELKRKRMEKEEEEKKTKEENKRKMARLCTTEPEEDNVELEEFEVKASLLVSKKEAMQTYCLPEGTLQVCDYVEKQNPHHKGWTPMKLYQRAEIRRRARKRFGGLPGLIAERNRRADNRLKKDLEQAKNIFN
eukprot:CAMPEP_0202458126 /NCGR_PEP_ID=MMETSP1360-20130828/22079_1 /ASSEMBLY_ACC=CAM_ASM_000848 /TAXON_ID=515479 /ORGANISM="Licmophora paradoxa, Strain CCMP2313" /LENGTH=150 /DNA_ID=CAMNT_0049078527 /DNA_START=269 /DNA_END=721 /DNA_ORIENTATION=+